MTTATTSARRSRKKSATDSQTITLRIEPRLRVTGFVMIQQSGSKWGTAYDVRDAKTKMSFCLEFTSESYDFATEAEAIQEAFTTLLDWCDDIIEEHPAETVRIMEVKQALTTHRLQFPTSDAVAAEASPAGALKHVETISVNPETVRDHPHQPRVSYAGIVQLAESMASVGQLDDAWGRRLPDGSIELIRGHRRKRAAIFKGLDLRVRIVDCSDAQALELIGVDDANWHEFDAVAKARWYRSMLDELQITQRELATRIGRSQADIANHVGILSLPEDWQQKVITQEITATMARAIAPWSGRRAVLKKMEEALAEWKENDDEPTSKDWEHRLRHVVRELTLPCDLDVYFSGNYGPNGKWMSGDCRLSVDDIEAHRTELDMVEVPSRWKDDPPELRAFNISLWLKLQGAAAARHEQQATSGSTSRKKSAASKADTSPEQQAAQEKEKRQQQAKQLKEKIFRYQMRWYQQRIIEVLIQEEQSDAPQHREVLQRLVLYCFIGNGPGEDVAQAVRDQLPKSRGGSWTCNQAWKFLEQATDALALSRAITGTIRRWLAHDLFASYFHLVPGEMPAIAESLGVSFETEWRIDEEFLELHTKDQLNALCNDWKIAAKIPIARAALGKRADLIQAILIEDKDSGPQLPLPKCFAGKSKAKARKGAK